jgi:hypothetical protein
MELKKLAMRVDTRLATLYASRNTTYRELQNIAGDIRRMSGQPYDWQTKSWSGNFDEALAIVSGQEKSDHPTYQTRSERVLEKYYETMLSKDSIEVEIGELEKIYENSPWSRAYLVTNNQGHIHKTLYCSSCCSSTKFEWLWKYSGDPEDDIVALAGETACTICYPSAPANILNQPSKIQSNYRAALEANKKASEAAKADREAKRLAKAPTLSGEPITIANRGFLNGQVVRIDYREIKSERAATIEWNRAQGGLLGAAADLHRENQSIIVVALAEKHGVSPSEMSEKLLAKYAKTKGGIK